MNFVRSAIIEKFLELCQWFNIFAYCHYVDWITEWTVTKWRLMNECLVFIQIVECTLIWMKMIFHVLACFSLYGVLGFYHGSSLSTKVMHLSCALKEKRSLYEQRHDNWKVCREKNNNISMPFSHKKFIQYFQFRIESFCTSKW